MELNVVVLKYYFSKKKNYGTYECFENILGM